MLNQLKSFHLLMSDNQCFCGKALKLFIVYKKKLPKNVMLTHQLCIHIWARARSLVGA